MKEPKKKKRVPFRQTLFWDVDPKTIDPQKHARYIIERVLEFGRSDELHWLFHTYPAGMIRDRVDNSRGVISKKSKALWSLILQ